MKKAALVLSALILAGCGASGQQEYDIGLKLSQAEKYQQAIQYMQQALKKEPDNAQYRNKLKDITSKLVGQLAAEVDTLLATQPLTIAVLDEAEEKIALVKKYDSSKAIGLSSKLDSVKTDFLALVSAKYQQGVEHASNKDWIKANAVLKDVQTIYPNYEQTMQMLTAARSEGANALLQQGTAELKADNIASAVALLKGALDLNPSLSQANNLLKLAEQNNNKDYYLKKANKAEVDNDWVAAESYYLKALDFDQFDSVLVSKLKSVRVNKELQLVNQANAYISQGYLFKAVETFKQAQEYSFADNNVQLKALQAFLSAKINQEVERFIEDDRYGSAYYWYNKLQDVNPQFEDLFSKKQKVEDAIYTRVRKSIAVFDFRSPSNNDDAGIMIANNLISYLFNNASKDINILERENLKSILEEMKLGQIGVVSENTAKEMGRIYGIDIAIMGSVLLFKVDETASTSNKTARYQIGEIIEDNIEYLNWKTRNPNPSKEELRTAPVAKIKVPKYAVKDYEVQNKKKVGFIQISYRIVDVATGVNTSVETLERKKVEEDSANAGIDDAGIQFDPMEVPTDTEILQSMTSDVVDQLAREVLKPLMNLEKEYFQQGEELLNRRQEFIPAVEKFTDAVFDEKVKSVNSPISVKSLQYIDKVFKNYKF
ncbi:CsgG/HfaB family protein [Catenovulum agarivorans]|uniref:CsgG/HfaB family protein n=1 Tax=Catenovulum agarivorans TaxID=1172192 RepID=UPI0003004A4B|nr:CsgG/HfaB family protein [Catenovulum agarivorans]